MRERGYQIQTIASGNTKMNMETAAELRLELSAMTDVTSPNRAHRDEDGGDSLVRRMMEISRDGLMVLDMDGGIREVNGSMARMLRYSRDELLRMRLWDFEAQWSRDELIRRIRAQDPDHLLCESVLRRKDGVLIDVEVSRAMIDWRGERLLYENVRDITERRKAEQALLEREELFRAIFNHAPAGVILVDCETLGFKEFNDVACQGLGYSREEFAGLTMLDVNAEFTRENHELCINDILERGYGVFETLHRHKDGSLLNARVSMRVVHILGRRYIVAFWTDITERRQAEAERIRLEEQLRQAQKMEVVGQLAGGIAHDFNNILTAIIGYATIVKMKLGAGSTLGPFLNNINHAAERAAALANDLLTFSRKKVAELRPVDLDEAVARTWKLMTRLIREDIRLTVSRSESPLIVMADDSQLIQVLLNLTANARDAMPQGGRIAVTTSPFVMDRDYVERHGYGKPGRYALLTFSDTGCGMDEKTRERIFEPFFTTKEIGKGTGLGLATVYGIVRQLEGFINVYSEPGKGTVFRIYLPEINGAPPAEETARSDAPMPGGKETVLLAEDDQIVRQLTELLLMEAGYTVITANDGAEAMGIFLEKGETVDLLVLDAIMPKKNGLEVLREAMEMRPDVAAIMISGYTSEIMVMNGFIKRAVRFLQKPVNPSQFLGAVREVLDKAGSGL